MSTTTTNYGLVKPELTDVADITQMNPNWDTIDAELGNINEVIENLDFDVTPEDIGALPIEGGTLTGDSLGLNNGDSEILSLTTGLSLITRTNKNSDDDRRRLILYNSTSTTDVSKAIRLLDTVDGTTKNYNLYGEHNKDLMAESFARCNTPLTLNVTSDGILQIIY